MEDARQILLQALDHAGIPLPPEAQSVNDLLSPSSLVSISLTCLSCIHGFQPLRPVPSSFSESSMSERFRVCNDLASSIKGLGYGGDLTFQQVSQTRFVSRNVAVCLVHLLINFQVSISIFIDSSMSLLLFTGIYIFD